MFYESIGQLHVHKIKLKLKIEESTPISIIIYIEKAILY